MTKLSNKKKDHALHHGESCARGFADSWIKDPKHFPRGYKSLPNLVYRFARVDLGMSCTHNPSEEEKALSAERAKKDMERFIQFHETCLKTKTTIA